MFSYCYQGGEGNIDGSVQPLILLTPKRSFYYYSKESTATEHESIPSSLTIQLKIMKSLHFVHLSSLCIFRVLAPVYTA